MAGYQDIHYLEDWRQRSYADDPDFAECYVILKRVPGYDTFTDPQNWPLGEVVEQLVEHIGGGRAVANYITRHHHKEPFRSLIAKNEVKNFFARIRGWDIGNAPRADDMKLTMRCWKDMPVADFGTRVHMHRTNYQRRCAEHYLPLNDVCVSLNKVIVKKFGQRQDDSSRTLQESLKLLFGHHGLLGRNPNIIFNWATQHTSLPSKDFSILAQRIEQWKFHMNLKPRRTEIALLIRVIRASPVDFLEVAPSLQAASSQFNDAIVRKFGSRQDDSTRTLQDSLKLLFGRHGLLGNPRIILDWGVKNGFLTRDQFAILAQHIETWKANQNAKPDIKDIGLLINMIGAFPLDLVRAASSQFNDAIARKFGSSQDDSTRTLQDSTKLLFGRHGLLGNPKIILGWGVKNKFLSHDQLAALAEHIEYWKGGAKADIKDMALLISVIEAFPLECLPETPRARAVRAEESVTIKAGALRL